MCDLISNLKLEEGKHRAKESELVSKHKSSRTEMMATLYEFYEKEKYNTDKLAYANWLYRNKLKPSFENIEKWKKTSGEYRKQITSKSFASFWLSHIPTGDLYYLISIAKDMENRKQSFNKWLFWSLKTKKD